MLLEQAIIDPSVMGTGGGSGITRITLDTDEGDISKFLTTEFPTEAEINHNIPATTNTVDEIVFDEPDNSGEYPVTPSVMDNDFNSLDLTMKEFTGDVFSKPITLEVDEPSLIDVVQKAIPAEKVDLVKENTLATPAKIETQKFNWWILIIAAAVLLGVVYLSKNKI